MSKQTVELAPGESKTISFEAVPSKAKTYSVSVNGLSGSFNAIAKPVAEFAYVSGIEQIPYEYESKHRLRVVVDVKNISSVAGLCTVQAQLACAEGGWTWQDFLGGGVSQAILQPGETMTFWATVLDSPAYGYTCQVRFAGDPGVIGPVTMI